MMSESLIIAYDLSAIGNHAYFFDDAPDNVFCDKCGCCIDDSYFPEDLKVGNRADISVTYDRRFISSLRFKEYIDGLNLHINFLPVNKNGTLFLMMPREVINYTAFKKNNYCEKCHQYFDQVMPDPVFYKESGNRLNDGMFFTSASFGSGKEKSPSIILGIETARIIKEAIKTFKFRGADISPIKVKVN